MRAGKLLTGSLPAFTFKSTWGGLRISFASGKRLPSSLSLSNDSDMGGEGGEGKWGGGLKNPLQFANVEVDMALTAIHFRACLSLLSTKLRG